MKTFLEYVAEDILRKYGSDLSQICVVFPNKRASLFLNDHLARSSRQPLWSPVYQTISELFRQQSALTVADPIKLVCDLHRCFTEQTGTCETLDHFYGWGQLLLSDFDDLDKNMADADKVFANLRDLHELDDISYLSDDQKKVIQQFFGNFSDDNQTQLKQRFINLWSHMNDIYHSFNERLSQQQLAYEGALYRNVVESSVLEFDYRHYIFVGFNMLQKVEVKLFEYLKKEGKASFYWDFDDYYIHGSEAGHYIGQYLSMFPNELDVNDAGIYKNFSNSKSVSYVSAPTENIQARYVSQWLLEQHRWQDGRRTAIVLCDENLLPAVIHCLPDEVEHVNITTGYPLSQSPVASLLSHLFALQTSGYSVSRTCFRLRQVNAVLRHPYVSGLSTEIDNMLDRLNKEKIYYPDAATLSADATLTLLFRRAETNMELLQWLCDVLKSVAQNMEQPSPITQESVFRAYTLVNRLHGLVKSGDLQVDIITLQRLLGQLMQTTSVPFHGEPAQGVQIMGVLETRNLDFDHVLLLSCNEGNMPKGVSDTSFIPYSLRKAYGLTTIDHKVSIFSYYFHRMLQRAHDVTLLYNNATSDGHTGEMSRFMLQLMVEGPHSIRFQTLQAGHSHTPFIPQTREKTPLVMQALRKRFEMAGTPENMRPLLTPSAINRYLRCPLQFYYCYVEGLREPDETDDDTIDNRVFGNIFHEASQQLYMRIMEQTGRTITADILETMLKTKVDIEWAVDHAIGKELFHLHPSNPQLPPLNGLQLINREVIIRYLQLLLEIDTRLAPFEIVGLEHDVVVPMQVGSWQTTIGGRIDRLDKVYTPDPVIRVIDYKTGARRLKSLADVDAIFAQESLANHSDYYLQTFIYSIIVRSKTALPVSPALLFIQHASGTDYDPTLCFGHDPIVDVFPHQERFGILLSETIGQMFSPDVPFTPTSDRSRCATCPYLKLCHFK